MGTPGPNPFFIAEVAIPDGAPPTPGWYYHDELGDWTGPFKTERKATKALLGYISHLEHGPTRWERLLSALRAFARDEGSGGRHDTRRARQGIGEEGASTTPFIL